MYIRILIALTIILSTGYIASSQEEPTPAPTKTEIPETQNETEDEEIEALTQEDLIVLNGNVQRPNGIAWHNDKIYAACSGDYTLYEIGDTEGETRTFIYGIRNAHTLFVESLGETDFNLWVPDYDTNTLMRVNPRGAPVTMANNLEGPWGIAYFDQQHFLITNLIGNNITLMDRSGNVINTVEGMRSPTGITLDEEIVYVANNGSSRRSIEWINSEDFLGDEEIVPSPLVSGVQNATGLVLGSDGYLYFAYALGTRGVVGRVNPQICREEGGCTNDQVEIVLYTDLAAPLAGLEITPDMRLFVHTIFRPEIYWVQL
jgi:hypothetical protein